MRQNTVAHRKLSAGPFIRGALDAATLMKSDNDGVFFMMDKAVSINDNIRSPYTL